MNSNELNRWRIDDPQRVRELRAFARQYNTWVMKLQEISVVGPPKLDGMPRGTNISDPTESVAAQREVYTVKINIVDHAIRLCSNDENTRKAVKINVTSEHGVSFKALNQMGLVYGRDAYYIAVHKFFYVLDSLKI